jgi:hypothetical protein
MIAGGIAEDVSTIAIVDPGVAQSLRQKTRAG